MIFELAFTFGFAAGGEVRAPELIVDVGLVGFQLRGDLELLDTSFDVAFLQ